MAAELVESAPTLISVILGSAVVSALIGVFFASRNDERKISIENITQERMRWREKVRALTLSISDAIESKDDVKLLALRNELAIRLNPGDPADNKILAHLDEVDKKDTKQVNKDFVASIALLLKHDWERSKLEASPMLYRLRFFHPALKWVFYKVPRSTPSDCKCKSLRCFMRSWIKRDTGHE